ncbi:MAG TPA: AAA family ATPase [Candidatus Eremiobacteraceae bacterium]|nr:AAA family ATPase [Candidatus Eremiobacteraceae bacterium]
MYGNVFQFFGLRENPFHVSPDPRFFFCTGVHASALAELTVGVESRQGLIVLIGEPGTGKTILLHQFLNWLHARRQSSAYIFQSQLKPLELFEAILQDFGVGFESRRKGDLLAAMNEWLLRRSALGDSPVLIIDEAQAISLRTLDRLRMLLNLEAPGRKLLQIVLAGQPQLEEKLRRPELRQLRQRVMFRCNLASLSLEETAAYVRHRLETCGADDLTIFPHESLEVVHIYAQGIPRVVNLLCEHALLTAYSEKTRVVTADMVTRVAMTFELTPQTESAPRQEQALNRFAPFEGVERSKRISAVAAALAQRPRLKFDSVPEAEKSAEPMAQASTVPQPAPTMTEQQSNIVAPATSEIPAAPEAPRLRVNTLPTYARTLQKTALSVKRYVAQLRVHWDYPEFATKVVHWLSAAKPSTAVRPTHAAVVQQSSVAAPATSEIPAAPGAPRVRVNTLLTYARTLQKAASSVKQHLARPSHRWDFRKFTNRFTRYWLDVGQSFLHDWKQFLQTYMQQRKASGARRA